MEEKKYPIGGFAPGFYSNTCVDCDKEFTGDKLARQCEPCAIAMIKYHNEFYKTPKSVEILNQLVAYELKWVCVNGHTNFKIVIGDSDEHDICLTCGKHHQIKFK